VTPDQRPTAPERDSPREAELHEELEEELDEMREHEDPTTVREAFEIEAAERGLSGEAGTVGEDE
jgi:hypothetical protein